IEPEAVEPEGVEPDEAPSEDAQPEEAVQASHRRKTVAVPDGIADAVAAAIAATGAVAAASETPKAADEAPTTDASDEAPTVDAEAKSDETTEAEPAPEPVEEEQATGLTGFIRRRRKSTLAGPFRAALPGLAAIAPGAAAFLRRRQEEETTDDAAKTSGSESGDQVEQGADPSATTDMPVDDVIAAVSAATEEPASHDPVAGAGEATDVADADQDTETETTDVEVAADASDVDAEDLAASDEDAADVEAQAHEHEEIVEAVASEDSVSDDAVSEDTATEESFAETAEDADPEPAAEIEDAVSSSMEDAADLPEVAEDLEVDTAEVALAEALETAEDDSTTIEAEAPADLEPADEALEADDAMVDQADDADESDQDIAASGLSPEEEADLMAELAALESEADEPSAEEVEEVQGLGAEAAEADQPETVAEGTRLEDEADAETAAWGEDSLDTAAAEAPTKADEDAFDATLAAHLEGNFDAASTADAAEDVVTGETTAEPETEDFDAALAAHLEGDLETASVEDAAEDAADIAAEDAAPADEAETTEEAAEAADSDTGESDTGQDDTGEDDTGDGDMGDGDTGDGDRGDGDMGDEGPSAPVGILRSALRSARARTVMLTPPRVDPDETGDAAEGTSDVGDADEAARSPLEEAKSRATRIAGEVDEAVARMMSDLPSASDDETEETSQDAAPRQGRTTPLADEVSDAVNRIAEEAARTQRAEAAATRRAQALGDSVEAEDGRVTRLLDAANSKLSGPEYRRRRSAIAHLKAAVAATRAEGGPRRPSEDVEAQPYREDLARVVRQTRKVPSPEELEAIHARALAEADASREPEEGPLQLGTPLDDDAPQDAELDGGASDAGPSVGETADAFDRDAADDAADDHGHDPADAPQPDMPDVAAHAAEDTQFDDEVADGEDDAAHDGPVRPRRPAVTPDRNRTRRPRTETIVNAARARAAPLMLVSEQRVDPASVEPAEPRDPNAPVRPRRIARGRLAMELEGSDSPARESGMVTSDVEAAGIFADSTAFADFADKMGAEGLDDLLECAAAYTAYVEGRPHFSHPQIMRVVRDGIEEQSGLSREESLRTFGQLLRQGRIMKVSRGQFTISKSSRYTPDTRSAAH
ncbi:MAG: hypothetical protein AAFR47_13340, partial [Pseudomonadota bacterium]